MLRNVKQRSVKWIRQRYLRFCMISRSVIKCDIDHVNLFIKTVKCSFFHFEAKNAWNSGFTQVFSWIMLIISFIIIKWQKKAFYPQHWSIFTNGPDFLTQLYVIWIFITLTLQTWMFLEFFIQLHHSVITFTGYIPFIQLHRALFSPAQFISLAFNHLCVFLCPYLNHCPAPIPDADFWLTIWRSDSPAYR